MDINKVIAAVAYNYNAGNRDNSVEFVAGEVADYIVTHYNDAPDWDTVYRGAVESVEIYRIAQV